MPAVESVSTGIFVRAGARHESTVEAGISHLLEHMVFKGTRRRSAREIKEAVEGTGGMLNAFTAEECTCYFAKTLRERYETALEVLADMVNHAVLPARELEREKTVILDEIRTVQDSPADQVDEAIGELMWPDSALGRPVAGNEKTVSRISRAQLKRFMRRVYHPGNFVVAVAGPVSHEDVVKQAARLFRRRSRRLPKAGRISKRRRRPAVRIVVKPTAQTHFVVGVHAFSRYHPDRYKLALLSLILGGNMSSRLFEELREKRGLAYDIKSGAAFYEETGALFISAGVEARKAGGALSAVLRELLKLSARKISGGEMDRAKDFFLSQIRLSLEDSLEVMLWAGEASVYRDKIPTPETIRRKIQAVTAESLRRLSIWLFRQKAFSLALVGPLKENECRRIRQLILTGGAS